ncbi:dynobactin maturation radical SAM/SPASM protein DynA [Microbulbifer epialgicus]|uniref:Dynobactin maturation radical SAM/SPASM protein DynA n=1 Tax=Microbulbifer epialgicus TaxID=393907 RepID=A0ABV4P5N3_9GAMM
MLTNVIKPTHACNLACTYCYNEDDRTKRMSINTLESTIKNTCEYARAKNESGKVDFIWHGGEPMLVGLDFYKQAIKFQERYKKSLKFENVMQTNGTLIDSRWCDFFVEEKFHVSISIDGVKHVNDVTRINRKGEGSFDNVFEAIQLVKKYQIPLGVCLVLNKINVPHLDEIYDFLRDEQLNFNVIPMTNSGDAVASIGEIGLTPKEYAEGWIKLYDRWFYDERHGSILCSDFANKSAGVLGGRAMDCIGAKNCSMNTVSTDHNGYVYPCATMSPDPEWVYGNINDSSIKELMQSDNAQKALQRKTDEHCLECKWLNVCNGGCISRADKFFGTIDTRDYYCSGLYQIYEHIEGRLREVQDIDLECLPPKDFVDQRKAPTKRRIVSKNYERFSRDTTTTVLKFVDAASL